VQELIVTNCDILRYRLKYIAAFVVRQDGTEASGTEAGLNTISVLSKNGL